MSVVLSINMALVAHSESPNYRGYFITQSVQG